MADYSSTISAQLPGIQSAGSAAELAASTYATNATANAQQQAKLAADQIVQMGIGGEANQRNTDRLVESARSVQSQDVAPDSATKSYAAVGQMNEILRNTLMDAAKAHDETGIANIPNQLGRWFNNTTEDDLLRKSNLLQQSAARITQSELTKTAARDNAIKTEQAKVMLDPQYVNDAKLVTQAALKAQTDSVAMTNLEQSNKMDASVAAAGQKSLEVKSQILSTYMAVRAGQDAHEGHVVDIGLKTKQGQLLDVQLTDVLNDSNYRKSLVDTVKDAKGITDANAYAEVQSLSDAQKRALQLYHAGVRTPEVMVPIYGIMNSGVPASATANPTLVNPVNAAIARNVHDAGAKFNSDMLNADGSPNEKSQLLQSGLSKYGIKFADYLKMPEAKKAALREEFATTSVIQNTLTSTDAKWLSGISPAAMYTNPQLAPHVPVALSGALDWQTAFNLVVAGHATPQQLQGMIQQGMKVENANSNRDSMGLKPVSSMPITLKVPGKWFGGVAGNSDLLVDMGNLDSIKLAVLQVKRSQQAANTTAAAVSNMGL